MQGSRPAGEVVRVRLPSGGPRRTRTTSEVIDQIAAGGCQDDAAVE